MEFVKFIQEHNHYHFEEASNMEMCILGNFLTDDVGCYDPTFRNWLFEDESDALDGNITVLEKKGNNIILGDLLSEQEDGGPYLTIRIDEFLRILNEWEQFCITKPKEIIITREKGVITLKGKN